MSIKRTLELSLYAGVPHGGHIGSEKGQSGYYSWLQICDAWCIKFNGVGYWK